MTKTSSRAAVEAIKLDSFFAQLRQKQEFGLEFEGAQIWLLGLDKHWSEKIYMVGVESYDDFLARLERRGIETQTYAKTVTHSLGLSPLVWLAKSHPAQTKRQLR
jgi:hypothetical protein